jgi:hypothetical protein
MHRHPEETLARSIMPNVMRSWIAATALLTVGCVALAVCQPVFTGIWIVQSKTANKVRAIVFTVRMVATGPPMQIREVSGAEDERFYKAIHEAVANVHSNQSAVGDAGTRMSHIGSGQSWCDDEDCHRLYFFIGSSKRICSVGTAPYRFDHPTECTLGKTIVTYRVGVGGFGMREFCAFLKPKRGALTLYLVDF